MKSNSNRSEDLDKFFHNQDASTNNEKEILSIAAVEDKLVSAISSYNTAEIDEDGIHIKWHYLDQAMALIYHINVYDPLPEFVIFTENIPQQLSQELDRLKVLKKKIVTNAVRRIYESVDPEYFHTNGVYGKVRWRFAS
jgi:hypothetical protein